MSDPTRRQLLRAGAAGVAGAAGALGAGALSGGVAGAGLLGPGVARAAAADKGLGDRMPLPQRLGRLVEIEMLLLFCYEHIIGSSIVGPHARTALLPFVDHERRHIAALAGQMRVHGGRMPAPPADVHEANRRLAHRGIGGRLGQLKGRDDGLRLLLTTEQVTIGAYFVALRTVSEPDLVELICQMMANDAQHDAMIGMLLPPGKPGAAAPYGLVQGLQ